MAGSFEVNEATTTITFQYTTATANMLNIIAYAAHILHNRKYDYVDIKYTDLTNQQKVNLVDLYIKEIVIGLARDYYIDSTVDVARETAVEGAIADIIL